MQSWIASGLGFTLNHIEEAFGLLFGLKGVPEEYLELDTLALLRSAYRERMEGLARGVISGIYSRTKRGPPRICRRCLAGTEKNRECSSRSSRCPMAANCNRRRRKRRTPRRLRRMTAIRRRMGVAMEPPNQSPSSPPSGDAHALRMTP